LSVVGFHNGAASIEESEIERIRRLENSGLPLLPWPAIKDGCRVIVTRGALEGVEGVVTRVKDSFRVVVNMDILRRAVAVEIDQDWLTVVSNGTQARTAE
jgi:transcription antitermination factor NusG